MTTIRCIIPSIVLVIGAFIFPDLIVYDSYKTLALAAILLWVSQYGLSLICFLISLLGFVNMKNIILALILIGVIAFFWDILAIYFVQSVINGFQINGILTYLILCFAMTVLRPSGKSSDKK